MNRRTFLASTVAFSGLPAIAQEANRPDGPRMGDPVTFTPDTPIEMARTLAKTPYQPQPSVPQEWLDLSYDQYRMFWFNTRRALWRDEAAPEDSKPPLQIDFFLPGLYFPRGIQVHSVKGGEARPVLFDLDLFDRSDMAPDLPIDDTLSFSGLRLRAEIETPGIHQEFVVFQGASYFRAIATGQVYGLSARGLALNTAGENGEEFPDFTHFWIEEPERGDGTYIIHALLNSPATAGAYRFEISQQGSATIMQVTTTLFPRAELSHVGIAPLTSMFLFDETNRNRFDDFRPSVHDSEGLAIINGAGEHIWRPLANPTSLQVSAFGDDNPRGFGLMQRDRSFSNYADLEALYHQRPSLWITPGEDWGQGAVTLVEIPTAQEFYDNIVAYWRPASPLAAGQEHRFSYAMHWGNEPDQTPEHAQVLNTRMGARHSGGILTAIDFSDHSRIGDRFDDITLVVTANPGEILGGLVQRNPDTNGPRLAFTFDPGSATTVELRAQLFLDNSPLSEVWLYRWTI